MLFKEAKEISGKKVRLNVIIPCTSVRLWWYMHISSHAVGKFSTPLCIMKSFTINCSLELATTIIICLSSNMDVWCLHLWRLLLSDYKVCSASDSMWKLLREFLTIHSNCFCLPIIRPCYLNANPYEITKTRHGQEIYDVPSDWSHKKSQTVFWLSKIQPKPKTKMITVLIFSLAFVQFGTVINQFRYVSYTDRENHWRATIRIFK